MQGLSPGQLLLAGVERTDRMSAWAAPQLAGRRVGGGLPEVRRGPRMRVQVDVGDTVAVLGWQLRGGRERELLGLRGGDAPAV